jgi:hypothetical protein
MKPAMRPGLKQGLKTTGDPTQTWQFLGLAYKGLNRESRPAGLKGVEPGASTRTKPTVETTGCEEKLLKGGWISAKC